MSRKLLILSLLLFPLCVAAQNDTLSTELLQLEMDFDMGIAQYRVIATGEPFSGVAVDYFPETEQVQRAVVYNNGYNTQSEILEFAPTGSLRSKLTIGRMPGIEQGPCTLWHENGQISLIGYYFEGKMDGTWTRFYDNGQREYVQHFEDQKRHGKWQSWNAQGQLVSTEHYRENQLLNRKSGPGTVEKKSDSRSGNGLLR